MSNKNWKKQVIRGFKFLDPLGATYYDGQPFYYTLPKANQKWGNWQKHPNSAKKPDGEDCGPNAFHVMRNLSAQYAPTNWWPWFAEGRGIVGESEEKFRCIEIRLRRIPRKAFWKIAKLGHLRGAVLRGADLTRADLRDAYLRGADLRDAYLRGADLRDAYLGGADLTGAYLTGAYLRGADLRDAYLRGADLTGAYLRGADLRDADLGDAVLRGADLTRADLTGADLTGAYLRGADLTRADLTGAYLTGAYLRGADLRDADLRDAYLGGAYLRGAYLRGAVNWGNAIMSKENKKLFEKANRS
jgi:uncharacterized protein YjbI with pentapeptide repeats